MRIEDKGNLDHVMKGLKRSLGVKDATPGALIIANRTRAQHIKSKSKSNVLRNK